MVTYGLEPRVGRLVPDDRARARDLPEARAGDGVILDRALVQRRVRTADVELRAVRGELKRELVLLDGLVGDGREEERVLRPTPRSVHRDKMNANAEREDVPVSSWRLRGRRAPGCRCFPSWQVPSRPCSLPALRRGVKPSALA